MSSTSIIPVILCGGTGSRLWPLSRKTFPKQFIPFGSEDNKSLLQNTQERLREIKNIKDPILICNEEHRFIVAEQMNQIGVNPNRILLEPFGRNTAPAVTLAALSALQIEDDPILLILSSDHKIADENNFIKVVDSAVKYCSMGRLVTFGVVPTSPETGYGYIKADSPFEENTLDGKNILEFLEKPNFKTASKLIKDKRYFWNSGMFMFKAKKILEEMKNKKNEIFSVCQKSLQKNVRDLDFHRIDKDVFKNCPDISIDTAIMEKTKLGTVLPLNAGWCDIGSWNSVWNESKKDKHNNFVKGKIILKDSTGCYLRGENRLIVAMGLEDLIVVETTDAILIADKSYSQSVKDIVNKLKAEGISEGLEHRKIYRPWGFYTSIVKEDRWQVKLISVKAGGRLSLQKHHHRAEHWVIVSGTAKVEIEDKEMILCENQSTFIPLGKLHRLSNPGKIPLSLIEIQSGSYLGEDDIERVEDNYGRVC